MKYKYILPLTLTPLVFFFPNATDEGVTWDEFQVICIGRTPCVGNFCYTINQEPSDGLLYKLCILGKSR